ncbi:DUF6477 family protein [Thioclava sp. 15-R06ZXC-3]|uniref:DUF6477 family protein n=1 Tax=Thioclava arctica TaxID=3238301 RepID=A0ABV3TJS7_9RHOB
MTAPILTPLIPDLHQSLAALRRPQLLVRAARFGAQEYNRKRDLKRLLRVPVLPRPTAALSQLIEIETEQDALRRAGEASYSLTHHIDLLIAVMGEARLLARDADTA